MVAGDDRWWGARSEYRWEQEALDFIRAKMPDSEPYRAWTTFTFVKHGRVREIDLLVAAPAGLFLVEIKSHPGRVENAGSTWTFRDGSRGRTLENPLPLTDRKAKELRGLLFRAADRAKVSDFQVPFVHAAVFLSNPGVRSGLDEVQRSGIYLRDRKDGCLAIWGDLLGAAPRNLRDRLDAPASRTLKYLLEDVIGIQGYSRIRSVGDWRLEPKSIDSGLGWADYLATHKSVTGDCRRVRVYRAEEGSSTREREALDRKAKREYVVLNGIDHPGIIKADSVSNDDDAGPAVILQHRVDWLRLDAFIKQQGSRLTVDTRLGMLRQLAEALDHAHRRHLFHRALSARSVYVDPGANGGTPQVRIGDWQAASMERASAPWMQAGTSTLHATLRPEDFDDPTAPYLAPEFGEPDAESVPLDVFGLGALSFLILTGEEPASDRTLLLGRLRADRGLVPSAVSDSIVPTMDEIVRNATRPEAAERYSSVKEFLEGLNYLEEELTAPEPAETGVDPLEAMAGTQLAGGTVKKVLGKGSTARALLLERPGDDGVESVVLKVALNDNAAVRLQAEADLLGKLKDSHVVALLEGVDEGADRATIVVEYAGEQGLAERLRTEGPLSIDDLESYGHHLLLAVDYLDGEGARHRDLKPDNIAIKRLRNNRARLVLFDFSLAGTPDSDITSGTKPYLDPFLGTARRPTYDDHAERYAVAVTLHEMASGELPSWGDGLVALPELLDKGEVTPQLAEDRFDPGLREGLVTFFRQALHRDAPKRFASLKAMSDAWHQVFKSLDEARPPTTEITLHDEPVDDVTETRDHAADAATQDTPLEAAGLTGRAVSVAQREFSAVTVGDLLKVPASRIQRLRGVGVRPRNDLLNRARMWRRKFHHTEQSPEPPAGDPGQEPPATSDDRPNLDALVARLLPERPKNERRTVELILALPDGEGRRSPVDPWTVQGVIAKHVGLTSGRIAQILGKSRARWAEDDQVAALRREVAEVLEAARRVMEAGELAAELLARRGSDLVEPASRLALGAAAARVAIEVEEKEESPRLVKRRSGDRVLIALCAAEGDRSVPADYELLDYAIQLGRKADEVVRREPLPSAAGALQALREVAPPSDLKLSEIRLLNLAAATSQDAAVTARLELYPRDLSPVRAVQMAQVVSLLGQMGTAHEPGMAPDRIRDRVLARFPELSGFPTEPKQLRTVLQEAANADVGWSSDAKRLMLSVPSTAPTTPSTSRVSTASPRADGRLTPEQADRRLRVVRDEGGFLAVKARLDRAAPALSRLRVYDGIEPVNVAEVFVTALRTLVEARDKPTWTTMLDADPRTAPETYHLLVGEALSQVEQRIRSIQGIALLYDATPLANGDGSAVLDRLADAARSAREAPYGLWLVCPMRDPHGPPLLDHQVVPCSDNEQLELPATFGSALAGQPARRIS